MTPPLSPLLKAYQPFGSPSFVGLSQRRNSLDLFSLVDANQDPEETGINASFTETEMDSLLFPFGPLSQSKPLCLSDQIGELVQLPHWHATGTEIADENIPPLRCFETIVMPNVDSASAAPIGPPVPLVQCKKRSIEIEEPEVVKKPRQSAIPEQPSDRIKSTFFHSLGTISDPETATERVLMRSLIVDPEMKNCQSALFYIPGLTIHKAIDRLFGEIRFSTLAGCDKVRSSVFAWLFHKLILNTPDEQLECFYQEGSINSQNYLKLAYRFVEASNEQLYQLAFALIHLIFAGGRIMDSFAHCITFMDDWNKEDSIVLYNDGIIGFCTKHEQRRIEKSTAKAFKSEMRSWVECFETSKQSQVKWSKVSANLYRDAQFMKWFKDDDESSQ